MTKGTQKVRDNSELANKANKDENLVIFYRKNCFKIRKIYNVVKPQPLKQIILSYRELYGAGFREHIKEKKMIKIRILGNYKN